MKKTRKNIKKKQKQNKPTKTNIPPKKNQRSKKRGLRGGYHPRRLKKCVFFERNVTRNRAAIEAKKNLRKINKQNSPSHPVAATFGVYLADPAGQGEIRI